MKKRLVSTGEDRWGQTLDTGLTPVLKRFGRGWGRRPKDERWECFDKTSLVRTQEKGPPSGSESPILSTYMCVYVHVCVRADTRLDNSLYEDKYVLKRFHLSDSGVYLRSSVFVSLL